MRWWPGASRVRRDRLADAALASKHAAELAQISFEGGLGIPPGFDAERTQLDAEDRLAQSRTIRHATITLTSAGRGSPNDRVTPFDGK